MTFDQFYREKYLPRHPTPACRLFHLLGLLASAAYLGVLVWLRLWWPLVLLPLPTYLVAWVGHLTVPNQPTFFEHPVWSFLGFWRMIRAMLAGRV
jgi:hypothetical protein